MDQFKWRGAVGCSITKKTCELLGVGASSFAAMESEVGEIFSKALHGKASFVHTMVHTTAAGYNELVWGASAEQEAWAGQVVLVATLGQNLGAVVFNDGRRVRNAEWCQAVQLEDGCPPQLLEVASTEMPSMPFRPPCPQSEEWEAWASTVDASLAKLLRSVPTLDRLLVLPTGRTAKEHSQLLDSLEPNLQETSQAAQEKECSVSLVVQQEGSVVRGAATCALVELEAVQMLSQMREILSHGSSLQSLSDYQLQDIFDRLDTSGTGILEVSELQKGLDLLGIQRDMPSLLEELGTQGPIASADFMSWWLKNVRSARIVTLSSASAWSDLLQMTPPEGFGDLILLEVTFTFCRACRAFEPKFRRLAEAYARVRFVQLVGNGTVGAMELVQELGIKKSPSFFIFRRGGEMLDRWEGADKLEDHLGKLAPF